MRNRALKAIKETEWVPAAGENRITGMIANRPDWVVSRQRAWGVPITVFVEKETKDRRKAIKGELMMKLGEAGSADIADGRIITKSIIRRGEYTVKPTEYVQLRHKLPRR